MSDFCVLNGLPFFLVVVTPTTFVVIPGGSSTFICGPSPATTQVISRVEWVIDDMIVDMDYPGVLTQFIDVGGGRGTIVLDDVRVEQNNTIVKCNAEFNSGEYRVCQSVDCMGSLVIQG